VNLRVDSVFAPQDEDAPTGTGAAGGDEAVEAVVVATTQAAERYGHAQHRGDDVGGAQLQFEEDEDREKKRLSPDAFNEKAGAEFVQYAR
jgi:hypothetical protein